MPFFAGRRSLSCAEADSQGLPARKTKETPQLQFFFLVVDAPVVQVVCPVCAGAQGSDSAENRRGPAVAVHQVRRQFCCAAEVDSHGPCDHGVPQLQYFPGGRCPCWQVVQILRCCLCEDSRDLTVAARRFLSTMSSSSLSWRRYRFPWSLLPQRFSSCSPLIR